MTRRKAVHEGCPGAYPVSDRALLKEAFTHTSYLNEAGGKGARSNERLEFLGDAVLQIAVSRMLFDRFPEMSEGEMTALRAKLVNRKTLAGLAVELGINERLLLGKGEAASGGAGNPTILAAAFEALIAAVYIDSGFKKAEAYIDGLFSGLVDGAMSGPLYFDYKPRLQEYSQRVFRSAPVYRTAGETGPQHRKTFCVEVTVNGEVLGSGEASSKKAAEQAAAKAALDSIEGRSRRRAGGNPAGGTDGAA